MARYEIKFSVTVKRVFLGEENYTQENAIETTLAIVVEASHPEHAVTVMKNAIGELIRRH